MSVRGNDGGVCVYAPSTIVTVTVEEGDDEDEIHFHAGGQGFWIARQLGRLGVSTTLCSVFGGESGRVAQKLVEAEPLDVRAVASAFPSGAWVHDRRGGDRTSVAEMPGQALDRHVADELFGATLATAIGLGACVLAGPHRPNVVPADHYRRLASDLRTNGATVVADLSGGELRAALEGGVDFCKVSEEDLTRTPELVVDDDQLATLHRVADAGAANVAITRGERPLIALIGGEPVRVRAPEVETVDHRGAGDAFTAVLTATQHWGIDWREGLRWGVAAGSLTVIRRGLATADRRELHQLLGRIEVEPF